ncbi:MAG: YabP/YqfC family sporulation protein [Clostridia bacterium]|nr:YabP/YqfC family sporulation protein [Clostridia bacterium]
MGFIDNILQSMGFDQVPSEGYKAVVISESAVYLENVKGLKKYTSDEVEFFLKKGSISVFGKDLFIKKYCFGDAVICGKIEKLQKN